MSVKVMGAVWDAQLPRDQKYVLLAYADHADHDGKNVYPSFGMMMEKTGYSRSQLHKILAKLLETNVMSPYGRTASGTIIYRINLDVLSAMSRVSKRDGGESQNETGGSHQRDEGVSPVRDKPSYNPSIKHLDFDEQKQTPEEYFDELEKGQEKLESPKGLTVEGYKSMTRESLERGGDWAGKTKEFFRQRFRRDHDWSRKTNMEFLRWLYSRPPNETIEKFADWWYENDWRGKKGQPPTIANIKECWPDVFDPKTAVVIESPNIGRSFRQVLQETGDHDE